MSDRDSETRGYASPACYAHELDELYRDFAAADGDTRRDVMRWRRAERERLLALRNRLSAEQRARELETICAALERLLRQSDVALLGAYWPMHGEPDLRAWLGRQADGGLELALPVIREKNQPLRYSRWQPGTRMRRGAWGIAEPATDDWVEPQMLLVPLLGVDKQRHRLGYGGGYFDRSLAAFEPRPVAVGIGYSCAGIATIYPQHHDIAMDYVITGSE
jgi:5,10-methenyltetrahydrofolate synthetase